MRRSSGSKYYPPLLKYPQIYPISYFSAKPATIPSNLDTRGPKVQSIDNGLRVNFAAIFGQTVTDSSAGKTKEGIRGTRTSA